MVKKRKKSKSKKYLSLKVITALKTNDVSKLRSLKKSGQSLGLCDRVGNNLLHVAILEYENKHIETIEAFEYLLTLDEIDKNGLNKEGHSPLLYSFMYAQNSPEYAIKLIEYDCELSVLFFTGESPLHMAVHYDWPEVIDLIMEKGVDVNILNKEQETALHAAAVLGRTDIIWMLLFYGAEPNIVTSANGKSDILAHSYTNLTFFDIIREDEALLNQFSNFDKNFNLVQFIRAMANGDDSFYKLMNDTCDINYNYEDLIQLSSRFFELDSKMFKMFVREFGYIVEELFQRNVHLGELFLFYEPTMFRNFAENLFALLECGFVSTIVHALNDNDLPILLNLIRSFDEHDEEMELLTQLLCGLLSYGVNVTPEEMNELYLQFGYCDLFKIMLHMNITPSKFDLWPQHTWPDLIYDIQKNLDRVVCCPYHDEAKMASYFTVHHLQVPSLEELARNASREFIIKKYQPRNSMQFYTILNQLPIPELHRKIISLERQIYF